MRIEIVVHRTMMTNSWYVNTQYSNADWIVFGYMEIKAGSIVDTYCIAELKKCLNDGQTLSCECTPEGGDKPLKFRCDFCTELNICNTFFSYN